MSIDQLIDNLLIPLFMWLVREVVKLLLSPFKAGAYVILFPFKLAFKGLGRLFGVRRSDHQ